MRFWVPNSADPEVDLVTDFHDKVMASADILSATGTTIMSFEEVMCQLPKYEIALVIHTLKHIRIIVENFDLRVVNL